VVLEPNAVADVLQNLALYGFNGKGYVERSSFVEPGATQFDAAVTLVDDPLGAGCIGLPFDPEGTPRGRSVLVEAGVTRALTYDRRSAAEAGAESTGHAHAGGTWGPTATNLRLEPGPGAGGGDAGPAVDPTAAALVSGVARGLLVTDLWYTRVLDPKTLVVTGLTRNGVWLVENGEVTTAIRNLRFTQSYARALGPDAVLGVGGVATMLPDNWGTAWWTAPALRLASWNFTGGASG
jgi:predicted Zn-dependent protease